MKIFKRQKEGFAMVTVLLMTGILLILMVALISLTSDTLYRSTADVERSTIVPLAEAGINEALVKIKLKPSWGTNKEKLLMRFGGQRLDNAKIIQANLPVDAPSQTSISYGSRGFYYISFDPNDTAFNGKKYISVNNLDPITSPPPSKKGWRGTDIPNGTASIVVTAAVGNTVKHIEVLVKKTLSGKATTGSRGIALFDSIKNFSLTSLNGTPSFHSNSTITIDTSTKNCTIANGGTVSATGNITVDGKNQTTSPYSIGVTKEIPDINMQDLINNIDFSKNKIPSGTYVASGNTLYYSNVDDANSASVISSPTSSFAKDGNIVPNLQFTGPTIQLKDDFEVDYDANNPVPGKTGNITIYNATLNMDVTITTKKGYIVNGHTLYTPGNGTRNYTDPNTGAPYIYGNMKIINANDKDVIVGRGNFYSRGEVSLKGKAISAGYSPEQVALLSDGDITLNTTETSAFNGLVYTKGDNVNGISLSRK